MCRAWAETVAETRRVDQRNHHAHILFTTRTIGAAGFGAKTRALDGRKTGPEETETLRATTAALINAHLERAGICTRVDHRSLADQARDAEARGDLAAAVLLTREPRRCEARAVVEQRRRGLPVAPGWNDDVRASNRAVVAGYLRGARAAVRSSSGGASSARARGPRFGGPGARALAVQASQARRRQRQDERGGALVFRDARKNPGRDNRTKSAHLVDLRPGVRPHARRRRGTGVSRAARPGVLPGLARALEARQAVEDAQGGVAAARDRRGQAMVRTVEAQNALERTDAEPVPSRLRVLSRREWFQKREAHRVALMAAQHAEREASESTGVRAAEERARLAQRVLDEVDEQRQHAYGVPSDGPRPVPPTEGLDATAPELRPPNPNPRGRFGLRLR